MCQGQPSARILPGGLLAAIADGCDTAHNRGAQSHAQEAHKSSMFILVQKSYLERPDPQTIDARHLETKGALHAIDRTNSTTSPRRHRTGRVGKFLDQGPRLAPAKRRRRRAGDEVRAARASFVIIAGEPNPSPPLQHVEEQLFFVRGGFFTCAASRSEFSNVVPRRRRDGCGLGRFARLAVRRGLRRTRAGARARNAPVA